jgi:hypothetical protein
MFALYKLEGARTYRFVREVKVGGILANHLALEGELLPPGFEGRMEWEISGNDLRHQIMKPDEAREESQFKLIIDATYGRADALLLEICHVWGFADPTWSPILLRLCHLYEGNRLHGRRTPLETFETDADCSDPSAFVHEFLYLQCGYRGGVRAFGRVGFTNGALLWPEHLDNLLSRIGYTKAPPTGSKK